jgi:hypothetical protein
MPESFQLAEAICKLLGHGPEKFHGTFLYRLNTYSEKCISIYSSVARLLKYCV